MVSPEIYKFPISNSKSADWAQACMEMPLTSVACNMQNECFMLSFKKGHISSFLVVLPLESGPFL